MSNKKQIGLIWLCWLVYTSAYLGRYSYNSNVIAIESAYGASHVESSLPMTFFFFAYGAGQIINGLCCKFYNKRIVLPCSLIVAAAINVFLAAGVKFSLIKYLWLINGAAQSFLWTSLTEVLAKNVSGKNIGKAVFIMSTTVACGTLVTYGLSALFSVAGGYKLSFIIGAAVMAAVGAVWFFSYGFFTDAENSKSGEEAETEQSTAREETALGSSKKSAVIILVCILGVFAVLNNFIKDGLTSWVPSIMKEEYGLPDYLSILCTLVLPVLAIFGTSFMMLLNKKVRSHVLLSAVLFFLSAVLVLGVILFSKTPYWAIIIICFGLISLFMSGINNIITSLAPMTMRGGASAGLLSGILNGCCYAGSTLSSLGLAFLENVGGWGFVFNVFLGISLVPVIIAAVYETAKKIHNVKEKI